jgi:hypothetical protein
MWKKINESNEEISEDEIISDFEVVYQKLENIQNRLNKSTNIELREKYMRHIVDFMNWLDYEI